MEWGAYVLIRYINWLSERRNMSICPTNFTNYFKQDYRQSRLVNTVGFIPSTIDTHQRIGAYLIVASENRHQFGQHTASPIIRHRIIAAWLCVRLISSHLSSRCRPVRPAERDDLHPPSLCVSFMRARLHTCAERRSPTATTNTTRPILAPLVPLVPKTKQPAANYGLSTPTAV